MKRIAVFILLLIAVGMAAWPQSCGSGCPRGEKKFSFTIPVGAIVSAISSLLGAPPVSAGATLLIPDIEVNLSTTFSGEASVSCKQPCCPEKKTLVMGVDLLLKGEATIHSIPPYSAGVTSIIPVVSKVYDNDQDCYISSDWSYTKHYTKVSLEVPLTGGLVKLPVADSEGNAKTECRVSSGCDEYETRPVILFLPHEVVVPIPRENENPTEVSFTVDATVFSSKSEGAPPPIPPLSLSLKPSSLKYGKARIEPTKENGKWRVYVSANHGVKNGTTEDVDVFVNKSGDLTLYDRRKITIRYVADHPPHAISGGTEIHCLGNGGCFAPVTFAATDPDGDPITLTVSGPGGFSERQGVGNASGTWSWTAWGRNPWQLVGFKATDKEA